MFRHLLKTEDAIDLAIALASEIANPRDLKLSDDRASGRYPCIAPIPACASPVRICQRVPIKEGSFERVDLTLLSVDEQKLPVSLRMRRMPLCEKPPWVGEPVIVAIPEGTARSRIMSPQLLPLNVRMKFSTVIPDVATTGTGSGVFDAGQKCLLGIMSRKITARPSNGDTEGEPKDIAKYFVPASVIRAFIPTQDRF